MNFADAIEDPSDELVIPCSARKRQGLGGVRKRLLSIAELDVDEGHRVQRSRLLSRIRSGVPMQSRSFKVADALQHRFSCATSIRGCRERDFARSSDPAA